VLDENLRSMNPLEFKGYTEKVAASIKQTGLDEAVAGGLGQTPVQKGRGFQDTSTACATTVSALSRPALTVYLPGAYTRGLKLSVCDLTV
jgi:hypothetical protein